MKLTALLFAFLSFSAFAAEIPLYTIDGASRYDLESLEAEYSGAYNAISLRIYVKKEYEVRGHPEMNVDYFIASSKSVSFGSSEVIATAGNASAVCATVDSHTSVVTATGNCKFRSVVNGDQIDVSLVFEE